jgi:succinate dehydrogenase/fumarate reductase cytochrome b subunit
MSSTATQPDSSYLLRKLHSLSGIVPVGAFLAEHFWSNSAVLVSPAISKRFRFAPSSNGRSFFFRCCITPATAFISGFAAIRTSLPIPG